jgi:hypothetical protein
MKNNKLVKTIKAPSGALRVLSDKPNKKIPTKFFLRMLFIFSGSEQINQVLKSA